LKDCAELVIEPALLLEIEFEAFDDLSLHLDSSELLGPQDVEVNKLLSLDGLSESDKEPSEVFFLNFLFELLSSTSDGLPLGEHVGSQVIK